MKKQVGGVGYYPTSGSPFVHLDTGSVRAWPRMTRAQLQENLPRRQNHTPALPMASRCPQRGYQIAMAEWKDLPRLPLQWQHFGHPDCRIRQRSHPCRHAVWRQ